MHVTKFTIFWATRGKIGFRPNPKRNWGFPAGGCGAHLLVSAGRPKWNFLTTRKLSSRLPAWSPLPRAGRLEALGRRCHKRAAPFLVKWQKPRARCPGFCFPTLYRKKLG